MLYFYTAPSEPPTHLCTSSVTNSSITVHWGTVECIHRNGEITGYSLQYGVHGNEITQTMKILGDVTNSTTILGLNFATNYSIEVAAVNRAGIGVFSAPLIVTTQGTVFTKHLCSCPNIKLWPYNYI